MTESLQFYSVLISAGLLVLLVGFELFLPARQYTSQTKWTSYLTNMLIFGFNNVVTFLLPISGVFAVVTTIAPAAGWLTTWPLWVQGILGVILLDFSIWLWHVLNHRVTWLWSFHKCHHSETYLNASSALRFHLGELLLSVAWKAGVLLIFGIPLWVFLLSEFLLTAFAMFHHSNIEFPPRLNRVIEYIIITPYLHRVHHSEERVQHDTNYGVIFSVWDRLFSTKLRVIPKAIGLSGIGEKSFWSFLIFPFTKK